MKSVIVTIKNGVATIEVEGVTGSACENITKDLEDTLGTVVERKKKPAYYEKQANGKARLKEGGH